MLGSSFESDQFAHAGLDHQSFLFAFVQQLLLSSSEALLLSQMIFLKTFFVDDVLGPTFQMARLVFSPSVKHRINLASMKGWVERGPRWHEVLLLISAHIDDAVLVLHEVLEAWSGVKYGRHRDR